MSRFYYSLTSRLDKNQSYELFQLISSLLEGEGHSQSWQHYIYVNNNFLGNIGDALSHEPQMCQPP